MLPETNTISNSNMCSISYQSLYRAIDGENFPMKRLGKAEWAAIAQCVNQGIDSHLEAITNASNEFDNGSCNVSPDNLVVLLRRLGEMNFDDDERFADQVTSDHTSTGDFLCDTAMSLQSGVLGVLGFNDCGQFIGRDE